MLLSTSLYCFNTLKEIYKDITTKDNSSLFLFQDFFLALTKSLKSKFKSLKSKGKNTFYRLRKITKLSAP